MEMTSRERMLAAINHQELDRVPMDIWAVAEVKQALRDRFGSDDQAARQLHLDGFGFVGPRYVGGPKLIANDEGKSNYFDIRHKAVKYATGTYFEQSYWPLANAATIDDIEAYAWPQAEWFDYSQMAAQARPVHDAKVVKVGYMAIFTYHIYLRGLENALMDPLVEPEFTRHLLGRLGEFFYQHHRRQLEAIGGLADMVEVTDDYGMQTGPLISLDVFREFYKPHVKRFCELGKQFGCKVFHHDDGAMSGFIPDLLECGIDVLNPIQWPCTGMDPAGLKRDYGKRLCFHGAVDNQRTLPFGTVEEVRAEVRRHIDVLAADKTGYILAPCHNIQANTPMENILAMYDECWNYGRF